MLCTWTILGLGLGWANICKTLCLSTYNYLPTLPENRNLVYKWPPVDIIEYVNVAHSIGSETLFKITGTCGQDPMVPLIAHPSFFLTSILFMYTTFCNFQCITVWHIYKKKQSSSSFYPYWVSDICIRFWKCFSLRHFGQLCILSIPDVIKRI
jgi:hypothetical protein